MKEGLENLRRALGDKQSDRKDIEGQIRQSTQTIKDLHEELQMLESHFIAQTNGKTNTKENGKNPQEERIKDRETQKFRKYSETFKKFRKNSEKCATKIANKQDQNIKIPIISKKAQTLKKISKFEISRFFCTFFKIHKTMFKKIPKILKILIFMITSPISPKGIFKFFIFLFFVITKFI